MTVFLVIITGVFSIVSGFILSIPFLVDQNVPLQGAKDATDPFRIYLAVICLLLGFINLFGASDIFLIGNLLPSIALILCAIGLSDKLLKYINFSEDPEKSTQRKEKVKSFITKSSALIGILTFIIGIIHFIFYYIPIL